MINLEDLQPKLLEELQKQSDLNASINKLAHKHGAKIEAKGPNAVLFLDKKLEELLLLKRSYATLATLLPKQHSLHSKGLSAPPLRSGQGTYQMISDVHPTTGQRTTT